MPMYKVTLSKRIWTGGYDTNIFFNPFKARLKDLDTPSGWSTKYKEWTFEAKNHKHVIELYREAKDQNISNVVGYDLWRIEEVPDHRKKVRGTYRDGAYAILHDNGGICWCIDAYQFMKNVTENDYKVKWVGRKNMKPAALNEVYVKEPE